MSTALLSSRLLRATSRLASSDHTMSTVDMKYEFGDSDLKSFEEAGIIRVHGANQEATLVDIVRNPATERLVEIDMVHVIDDLNLKVAHNLPMMTKTYYTSSIRSLNDYSNMKKCPSLCFPKTVLCSTATKGLIAASKFTRKKPPHEFYPFYSTRSVR